MKNKNVNFKTEKELQDKILQEKARGSTDFEIGQKYGVTFRYIERLVTKSQGLNVSDLSGSKKIKTFHPKSFKEEQTTIWSFKQRGNWATHSGEYRGNWSPYIPRNVILKYSEPDELVMDYFCGAGTTAVEAKLLGRKCIAFDINDKAIKLAKNNINFNESSQQLTLINEKKYSQIHEPELLVGDARDLSFLLDNSIDLICAHPPYSNIINYTDSKEGDLSFLDINEFLKEMARVAKESFRVLKKGRQCAILIGDTRKEKHVIPLGFKLMNVYLDAGFKLKELIIKRQHNCKTTGFWYANSIKYNFLLLAHEYLPIFEKPEEPVPLNKKENSTDYRLFTSKLSKPSTKRKLDKNETTTVWILPDENIEERLNKNVIDRYSNGKDFSTTNFVYHFSYKKESNQINVLRGRQLLFIKSPFLSNNPSYQDVEYYLKKTKEIVNRELSNVKKGGFLVIQTRDVRINEYIEPLAKRLIETLTLNILWLKEIIIVTQDLENPIIKKSEDCLQISHQYLVVFEVKE